MPDGHSAETRLVAGPDEGFEEMDWNGAESSPIPADEADMLPANDVAESGIEISELGNTVDI